MQCSHNPQRNITICGNISITKIVWINGSHKRMHSPLPPGGRTRLGITESYVTTNERRYDLCIPTCDMIRNRELGSEIIASSAHLRAGTNFEDFYNFASSSSTRPRSMVLSHSVVQPKRCRDLTCVARRAGMRALCKSNMTNTVCFNVPAQMRVSRRGDVGVSRFRPSLRSAPSPRRTRSHICRVTSCAGTENSAPSSTTPRKFGGITILLCLNAVIWSLFTVMVMLVVQPLVSLLDRKRRRFHQSAAMVWMRDTIRGSFLTVRVLGQENLLRGPALYVCNHQSPLDIFVLAFLRRPLKFMLPAKAFRLPVIGWIMSLAGWIRVEGTDRRSQMNALKAAGEELTHSAVVVFPEGVPSTSGRISKFSPLAFRAATEAGVPVLPLTIHGTGSMCAESSVLPVRRPTRPITITIHEPISQDVRDTKEIATRAYDVVRSALPQHLQGS